MSKASSIQTSDAASLLNHIASEVWWSKQYWCIYKAMSCTEEHVSILGDVGPSYFGTIQSCLPDHVALSIVRLLDPAATSGKPNLTLYKLADILDLQLNDATFSVTIKHRIDEIKKSIQPLIVLRNKRLAHNDLPTRLSAIHLANLPIEEYDKALKTIEHLLSDVCVKVHGRELYIQDEGSHAVGVLISKLRALTTESPCR